MLPGDKTAIARLAAEFALCLLGLLDQARGNLDRLAAAGGRVRRLDAS